MEIDSINAVRNALGEQGYGYVAARTPEQAVRAKKWRRIVNKTRNPITESIIGLYVLKTQPHVLIELSGGEFLGGDIYGITVLDLQQGIINHDKSTAAFSPLEVVACFYALDGQ